jgi:hypothetical protein
MANIGIRSPYFIYKEEATAVSAKIEISIDSTLEYTITKNTGASVRLDISELVKDFVTPTYNGTLTTNEAGTVDVDIDVKFYDEVEAGGTQVGTTQSESHVAYYGYGYFSEGHNFDFDDRILLSETTIWMPEDTTGTFYRIDSGVLSVVNFAADAEAAGGITIKRQPCDRYTPIKAAFINKFGVPQQIYFFAKNIESMQSTGETYMSNKINANGSYSTNLHQVVDFDKNAKISYSLSSGYTGEAYNSYIQEMLLSEQVWLVIDSVVKPVRVTSSNVQYKTTLNDKLVSYTIEFEEANDLITSIR